MVKVMFRQKSMITCIGCNKETWDTRFRWCISCNSVKEERDCV